jgi:GntR family transcriptional regulator
LTAIEAQQRGVPKSELLRRHLLEMLNSGMVPHDKLSTERELAGAFSVSRLTVRRVLDRLEREGRVYRIQGAGTFVSEPRIAKSVELTSFSEDMRSRGLVPGSLFVEIERIPAGAEVGYALGISPAATVVHIRRVRTADAEPMCLENCYLPGHLVPEDMVLAPNDSLYAQLSGSYNVHLTRADQTIRVTVLSPADADALHVPPLSPAFRVERIGYDARGQAIEQAQSLYRGDRYSYELTILREAITTAP